MIEGKVIRTKTGVNKECIRHARSFQVLEYLSKVMFSVHKFYETFEGRKIEHNVNSVCSECSCWSVLWVKRHLQDPAVCTFWTVFWLC